MRHEDREGAGKVGGQAPNALEKVKGRLGQGAKRGGPPHSFLEDIGGISWEKGKPRKRKKTRN